MFTGVGSVGSHHRIELRAALLGLWFGMAACRSNGSQAWQHDAVGVGQMARVGDVSVPAPLVARVALAQHVPAEQALDDLVEDALSAQWAGLQKWSAEADVEWPVNIALARNVALRIRDRASAQGLPTDDELATVTVMRALVMRSPRISEPTAKGVAERIRQAVALSQNPAEFTFRTNAVPTVGARVVVNQGTLSADGQLGRVAPSLVAAALSLPSPHGTSAVIETDEGWSVLHLIERVPPDDATKDARRRDLTDRIASLRARSAFDSLLHALRSRDPVQVMPGADDLMEKVVADRL
jgi:hypothetical protein